VCSALAKTRAVQLTSSESSLPSQRLILSSRQALGGVSPPTRSRKRWNPRPRPATVLAKRSRS